MAEIRVGISGWTYAPWRGNFYPKGLPQTKELAYASRRFNALEVNGTFYSMQTPSAFQQWYEQTPAGFVFALKGGRFITHLRKLKEPKAALANFFASGVLALKEKLGPILWQFPPQFGFNEERFKEFFEILPRDMNGMARLGKDHDKRLKDEPYLEVDENRRARYAVEIRHESFLTERFVELLRQHNMALVVADVASKYPTAEDITADFVYVRLHGSRQLYASGYTPKEIKRWAGKVNAWNVGKEPAHARRIGDEANASKKGRDVFVFFDNTDVKLRAPKDAGRMAKELGIGTEQTPQQLLKELGAQRKSRARRA